MRSVKFSDDKKGSRLKVLGTRFEVQGLRIKEQGLRGELGGN